MGNKVTIITTVLNEEASILSFLNSIYNQTRKPDEVIIVDGGSTDNTVKLIRDSKFTIIQKKGNRSVGRNTAIKASSNSIIAVTDAGCILDKNWLERLIKPFENKTVDVVAGFYKPLTPTIFQKCLATYTCTMPDKLDKQNFLPSSRSVAFKKVAWEKVKGYPEDLDTCEDLVFDKKLKGEGYKFETVLGAFVWWPQRKNIWEAAKQFYHYAKGDGEARYFRKTTPILFARYIVGLLLCFYLVTTAQYWLFVFLIPLLLLYFLWATLKNYKYVKNSWAFVYLPALQLTSDVATLIGNSVGFFSAKKV